MISFKALSELFIKSFDNMHDGEVDAFAEGIGVTDDLENLTKEQVINLILEHCKSLTKDPNNEETDCDETNDSNDEKEQDSDEEEEKPVNKTKEAKPVKKAKKPKTVKPDSKSGKPSAKQLWTKFKAIEEKRGEEENLPEGFVSDGAGAWQDSPLNAKSDAYDEAAFDEIYNYCKDVEDKTVIPMEKSEFKKCSSHKMRLILTRLNIEEKNEDGERKNKQSLVDEIWNHSIYKKALDSLMEDEPLTCGVLDEIINARK